MLARVLLLLRIERCLEAEAAFDVAGFGDVVLAAELDRVEGARPRNRGQSNGFWIKIQVKQGEVFTFRADLGSRRLCGELATG